MHPALKVPEILYLIFEDDFTQCDLVNCSLVCHLWNIWAQDVLLRTGHVSLERVLQPLSPIAIPNYNDQTIPYLEIGSIEEAAWCHFLALSNKITKLAIDCTLEEVSLERIKRAKQKFKGDPFIQLKALQTVAEGVQFGTIMLVTVPSLSSVFLSRYTLPSDNLTWVSNTMPATAPNIIHFGIVLSSSNGELEMSRYSALEHLELRNDWILPQFWESLANCKLLAKVVLTCAAYVKSPIRALGDVVTTRIPLTHADAGVFKLGPCESPGALHDRPHGRSLEAAESKVGSRDAVPDES
ncbi:hypothetical protein FRC01_004941 [Tulasnella sp. 417]|nr:hypothetical protein FRC01_004941 [Tulasnella sp. 417]